MRDLLSVGGVEIGMYVAGLDRPWHDTAFPASGFLVADERQLVRLATLCSTVEVDRTRSTGRHFQAPAPTCELVTTLPTPLATVTPITDTATAMVRPAIDGATRREPHGAHPASDRARPTDAAPLPFVALLRRIRGARGARGERGSTDAPADTLTETPTCSSAAALSYSTADVPDSADARTDHPLHARDAPALPDHRDAEASGLDGEMARAWRETRTSILALIAGAGENLPDPEALRREVDRMVRVLSHRPDALAWTARLSTHDAAVSGAASHDHAIRVAAHLIVFARHLGLDGPKVALLGLAGLVQDLGKLRLPRNLFRRQTRASHADVETFRLHVRHTLDMLAERGIDASTELARIVARHHERIDGSGYPAGLAGEAIGLAGEMAGIVDAYCAFTHPRRPGRPLDTQQALERLGAMRGTRFTASVVDAFVQCIGLYPAGTLVELSTGEIAVVVEQNRVRCTRPVVIVLLGPDRSVRERPATIDLDADARSVDGRPCTITGALSAGVEGIDPGEFYLA